MTAVLNNAFAIAVAIVIEMADEPDCAGAHYVQAAVALVK